MAYKVYMNLDLLESVPKRGAKRGKIIAFLRGLRERPTMEGDYREKDNSLRDCEVKIIGDHEIVYWFDAPVNIVMVVGVRPADK